MSRDSKKAFKTKTNILNPIKTTQSACMVYKLHN